MDAYMFTLRPGMKVTLKWVEQAAHGGEEGTVMVRYKHASGIVASIDRAYGEVLVTLEDGSSHPLARIVEHHIVKVNDPDRIRRAMS